MGKGNAMPRSDELFQAQAELWRHALGYLKSMALHAAVKLGIPDAISRRGGAASLSDLSADLPLRPDKQPCLSRLMRILAMAGIFTHEDVPAAGGDGATTMYGLTPVSRILVDNVGVNGAACLARFVLLTCTPYHLASSLFLQQWLRSEEEGTSSESPFVMANGEGFYGVATRDQEFNAIVNEAMACDSQFVAELFVRECTEVFVGIASLVDVGGGNGTTARAIAKAFPHVKCSVLELQHVVDDIPADGLVEFVAGDMMEFIPPADVILLKSVLHNWSDQNCVKILTRCREAIAQGSTTGKVIIIDTVVGSPSQEILEAQLLMDLCMMVLVAGKERDEQNWHKIFIEAGFSRYKIKHILGVRSVIEVYP